MKRWAMMGALTMMSVSVWAADTAPVPQVGERTREWLDLQTSGNASLGAVRPMPGEVADKVYQRYLKSFEQDLPTQFDREKFVSDGGS